MAKQITFAYGGKEYTLEFNRTTIKTMRDRWGFTLDPSNTMDCFINFDTLFKGALMMHHASKITDKLAKEMVESMTGKKKLLSALIDVYIATYDDLINDDDDGSADEGNVNWRANFDTDK